MKSQTQDIQFPLKWEKKKQQILTNLESLGSQIVIIEFMEHGPNIASLIQNQGLF